MDEFDIIIGSQDSTDITLKVLRVRSVKVTLLHVLFYIKLQICVNI